MKIKIAIWAGALTAVAVAGGIVWLLVTGSQLPRQLPLPYGPSANIGEDFYLVQAAPDAPVSLCRWAERPEGDCVPVLSGDIVAIGYDAGHIAIQQRPASQGGGEAYYYITLHGITPDGWANRKAPSTNGASANSNRKSCYRDFANPCRDWFRASPARPATSDLYCILSGHDKVGHGDKV